MELPEQIGRYTIARVLGEGGMAVVFLAHDPVMDRQVALKLLPRQWTFNAQLRARFQNEARVIASLEHPAIVPVHDFGEFNEQPYLVMRYMPGGSLRQRITGPMPLGEIVRILTPVAAALDKAHTQRVIHRDLKPDNILFDLDGNPYLADFGIARLAEGTQTTSIMGTPAYMSPEQVRGDIQLDGRSDVYALGVILFEMLSGRKPYVADTPTKLMMMHVLEPVPNVLALAVGLPPATQAIIARAMAKDRTARYPTATALVDDIKALLKPPDKPAPPPLPGTRASMRRPRPSEEATVVEPLAPLLQQDTPAALAELYGRFQAALAARDWVEALDLGAQIKRLAPLYRDVDALLAQARAGLAAPAPALAPARAGAPPRAAPLPAAPLTAPPASAARRPLWLWIGGALLLLTLCGGLGWIAWGMLGGGEATAVPPTQPAATEAEAALAATAPPSEAPPSEALPSQAPPTPVPTATPAPTETPAFTPTPAPGAVLLRDDFETAASRDRWALRENERYSFSIENGRLIAVGRDAATFNWAPGIDPFETFDAVFTVRILEGGSSAFFGVVYQLDGGDDYLGCMLQGDNSGYCFTRVGGEATSTPWMRVNLRLLAENEARFVVLEDGWALIVNEQCVGSGSRAVIARGVLGFLATTAADDVVSRVGYDNLTVRAPDAGSRALLNCEPQPFQSAP